VYLIFPDAVVLNKIEKKWRYSNSLFQTIPNKKYDTAIYFTHTHFNHPYQFQTKLNHNIIQELPAK
jgi:hypothetical protein